MTTYNYDNRPDASATIGTPIGLLLTLTQDAATYTQYAYDSKNTTTFGYDTKPSTTYSYDTKN